MADLVQTLTNDPSFKYSPLAKYLVRNHFLNNDLFRILPIENIATINAMGVYTYDYEVIDHNIDSVIWRKMGNEGKVSNVIPETRTVEMAILTGKFNMDIQMRNVPVPGDRTLTTWVQRQLNAKTNDVINAFARAFIQGDKTVLTDEGAKQFDGIDKLVDNLCNETTPFDAGTYTDEAIRQFTSSMANLISAVPGANCIITSKQAWNIMNTCQAYRGLANNYYWTPAVPGLISRSYPTYEGIPVVALTSDCFNQEDMKAGHFPFYICRLSEFEGVKLVVPQHGEFLTVCDPRTFENGMATKEGYVELMCGIAAEGRYSLAKGYVTATIIPKDFHRNALASDTESEEETD